MPKTRTPAATTADDLQQANDADLIEHAIAGSGNAFAVIMQRNNQRLYRTARSVLASDADAQDAVQEAYLKAWRSLKTFRSESSLSTWLVRITINEALGRQRRQRLATISLEQAMESANPSIRSALIDQRASNQPDSATLRSEWRKRLEHHISLLPEHYRTVFMLYGVEEMKAEEVSQALDLPPATVRTRYHRARALLREQLNQELDRSTPDAFRFGGQHCSQLVQRVLARAQREGLCHTPPNTR